MTRPQLQAQIPQTQPHQKPRAVLRQRRAHPPTSPFGAAAQVQKQERRSATAMARSVPARAAESAHCQQHRSSRTSMQPCCEPCMADSNRMCSSSSSRSSPQSRLQEKAAGCVVASQQQTACLITASARKAPHLAVQVVQAWTQLGSSGRLQGRQQPTRPGATTWAGHRR